MKTLSNEECILLYGSSLEDTNSWDGTIDKSIICTIVQEESVNDFNGLCYRDAGSPLVKDGRLIGTAIHDFCNMGPDTPDQFTRISEYLDFIKKHVNVVIE